MGGNNNPTGKGGFVKGQVANPGGRPKRHIGDLSREARRYAHLALRTLVKTCKSGMERNQLVAARELLDRGYGRPLQTLSAELFSKKLSELTPSELESLDARVVSAAAEDAQADFFQGNGSLN